MKILFTFLIVALLSSVAFAADTKTITLKHNCYAKTSTDNGTFFNWRNSTRNEKALKKGTTLNVIKSYGDYFEVKIVKGATAKATSDNAGKKGFMWSHCVDAVNAFVINEGVNLRTEPRMAADTLICGVKNGAKLEIVRLLVTYGLHLPGRQTDLGYILARHHWHGQARPGSAGRWLARAIGRPGR